MAKKSKKSKTTVTTHPFIQLLKKVFLSGLIEECFLKVKKGKGSIEAIDITNSLVVIGKSKVMSKDATFSIGIGNIDLLIKFLSTIDDSKILLTTKEGMIILKRKDGRRKLNYLLTEPDLIATRLNIEDDEQNPYDKVKSHMQYSADLSQAVIQDFLKYISLLKSKETTLEYQGEYMMWRLGGTDEHQFEIEMPESAETIDDDAEEEPFELKVNGDHLAHVFNVMDFDEDDPPKMLFAEGKPVLIEDGTCSWALMPQSIDEGEE